MESGNKIFLIFFKDERYLYEFPKSNKILFYSGCIVVARSQSARQMYTSCFVAVLVAYFIFMYAHAHEGETYCTHSDNVYAETLSIVAYQCVACARAS